MSFCILPIQNRQHHPVAGALTALNLLVGSGGNYLVEENKKKYSIISTAIEIMPRMMLLVLSLDRSRPPDASPGSLSALMSRLLMILSQIEFTSCPESISGFQSEAVNTISRAFATVSRIAGYFKIQFSQNERIGGSSGNRTHLMNRFSIANSSADNSENGFIFTHLIVKKEPVKEKYNRLFYSLFPVPFKIKKNSPIRLYSLPKTKTKACWHLQKQDPPRFP